MREKLNKRQELFCLYFSETGNTYQSAIKAGYSENYASGRASYMLENASVKERLEELYNEKKKDSIANAEELRTRLTEIVRSCVTDENIVVESSGNGFSEARLLEKKPAFKDQLKAIELLARMGGMFTDKLNVTGAVPIVIRDDLNE